MNEYIIATDSSADLPQHLVEQLGIEVFPLAFTMGDKTYFNYFDNREMDLTVFYSRLRGGDKVSTSAVNVGGFTAGLEPILQSGRDVLLIAFSSGLSATYQSAVLAADDLKERYPDRTVLVVDSLSASMGQGLLVYLAAMEKQKGKSIAQVGAFVEAHKGRLCHWFTVDDLMHLKRGGRISGAAALVGSMLSIKPVLKVDDGGHLISCAKARGRGAALKALVDQLVAHMTDPNGVVGVSHADCAGDAQKVVDAVRAKYPGVTVVEGGIGPVIGAHAGPGTVALFFLGTTR